MARPLGLTPEERIERNRARARAWAQANPERNRARAQEWYKANTEQAIKRQRAYDAEHPEQKKEAQDRWNAAHQEEVRAYKRAWKQRNPEKVLADRRARKPKPEVKHAADRRRRAREAGAPINDFTAAQWAEMKAAYSFRCVYCSRKMQHLTQDHIIPLSKGGSHTASNIVPACASCNSRKNAGAPLVQVQPLLLMLAPARKKKD